MGHDLMMWGESQSKTMCAADLYETRSEALPIVITC